MHVLANDSVTTLTESLDDPNALWITSDDLKAATGFDLKPEGACLGDLCVPIQQDTDSELYKSDGGKSWVNASALAAKLNQPVVIDSEEGVWSFGAAPSERASTLESAIAPDFEIADRDGKIIRMKDFRGKKVLLYTWASW
jgi:hypothetical protein